MMSGAEIVVKCLESMGVDRIFGIPGAKIDAVFNALLDSPIQIIVCRHEQNATFMAAIYGRLTGKPGVVIVTSGPGVGNLTTGLLTATTEGDPIIAIAGNVPRSMLLKASHQNTNSVKILEAATKFSVEVTAVENIPEVLANAYRNALMPHAGSCFVSLPQDVLSDKTSVKPLHHLFPIEYAAADMTSIRQSVKHLSEAKFPVLFLGQEASRPENAEAIHALLRKTPLPVVGTYQAAGTISRDLVKYFVGRVGLFKNQIGDQILEKADVVLCVGFNPVEYDPEVWNAACSKKIIHLDFMPANLNMTYQPECELLGSVSKTLALLTEHLSEQLPKCNLKQTSSMHAQFIQIIEQGKQKNGSPIHPLRFIAELRSHIDDDTLVICDIGTVYMWIARYFLCYKPRHLLFSNGQQTLGVALPWALSSSLIYPNKKIVSISGDGGFLFSAMELETAVREGARFVHFIWRDGAYNMVLEQEILKYGRKSGVDFGMINVIEFANSFGAKGFVLDDPNMFEDVFKSAMSETKPVLIDVPIDYSDNPELFVTMHDNVIY